MKIYTKERLLNIHNYKMPLFQVAFFMFIIDTT